MKGAGKIILALALVLVGAIICAGCISTPSEQTLEGSWTLNSDENIFITFNKDGSVSGKAPVNGFGATYTVDGNSLTFGKDIIQTLMAGSPEKMQAESEFFEALKNTARWQIADDKLILADADDKILAIFTASVLGAWDGEDGTSIIFSADGTVNGHAPINSFGGSYTAFGSSLVLENLFMTEMAGPAADMKAEDKFISALNNAAGFTVSNGQLILVDAKGKELLTFERHFEPAGEWVLNADSNVTIIFNGDGTITGQAPVNLYGGKYFISGDSLTFSEGFDKTMMAGSAADMQAETAFFQALGKTAGFTFADANLVFVDAKGKELLTFERPTAEQGF
ncbi:MAG: META domain-containing protein [Methanocorpusculum sp.]|nr:META domain-containing protein [Methanocorpusculum sp.]